MSSSSASSASSSSAGSGSSASASACVTQRLIAIASPTDLRLKRTAPDVRGGLYLTDQVTILCRSRRQLEQDVDRIIADVKVLMKLQRQNYDSFEIQVIEDVPLPNVR